MGELVQSFDEERTELGAGGQVDSSDPNQKLQIGVVLSVLLVLGWLFYPGQTSVCQFQPVQRGGLAPFRKVLWLYTQNELEAERFYELLYLYHFNHTFRSQGYEVHLVNSLTAYDHIPSNHTVARITQTMQASQIDEGVDNLLKLALLAEHGGVMINAFDTVFPQDDLRWI
jgi:hypothetical protein